MLNSCYTVLRNNNKKIVWTFLQSTFDPSFIEFVHAEPIAIEKQHITLQKP
jgi:hypothetical protein